MKKLKIAFLSPLFESVPPKTYGGTELIVYYLAEGLKERGYDVTVFASGDSKLKTRLIKMCPKALRTDPAVTNPQAYISLMMGKFFQRWANKFDIISNHTDFNALVFSHWTKKPIITTCHGVIIPERRVCYTYYNRNTYFISISKNQRNNAPYLRYIATIYHGIDLKHFKPNNKPMDYLFWLGRISPDKGTREAIEIAHKTGRRLILAGKIDDIEMEYFEKQISPFIDGKHIQFADEVTLKEKAEYLKNAYALLSPLNWQEPFGLIVIESLACGTPVLTTRRGSMPEIIDHGKTGFIARNDVELEKYVDRIPEIDRTYCRKVAEERYNKERMIDEYEKVFLRVHKNHCKK